MTYCHIFEVASRVRQKIVYRKMFRARKKSRWRQKVVDGRVVDDRIWFSHPSSSVVRLPVDEPALASTTTHDHAKDLCASELGLLRI